ncbi:hypothetical protein WBG99_15870 [Streptomyces sp. TG1A-60]|uniref:hypothetical protein n=1 Tax=Streptomyces sp. TG1A-60 TaxID=3129111 RepID=UPI0030CF8A27
MAAEHPIAIQVLPIGRRRERRPAARTAPLLLSLRPIRLARLARLARLGEGTQVTRRRGPESHLLGVPGGADTVRLWNLDVDDAVRHICATTRGALTRETWDQYLPRPPYEPPREGA